MEQDLIHLDSYNSDPVLEQVIEIPLKIKIHTMAKID